MHLIDLRHLGRERVIGSWLVGDVLIDPGPQSCIESLLSGLDGREPKVIALTHIHLDHAGATGSLLQRFPSAEVWVHERGAPHVIDPARLLASASRLYGDEMERLWGEVLPVPADRVRRLTGGEAIGGFRVAYTPGHASHHVSYFHEDSRTAFCGDVTGVRIADQAPVLAHTPPPDVDVPGWRSSLEAIASWEPIAIVPTHFGRYHDVADHLAAISASLADAERLARAGDQAAFERALRDRISTTSPAIAAVYEQAMPLAHSFAGLRRYIERS